MPYATNEDLPPFARDGGISLISLPGAVIPEAALRPLQRCVKAK